MECCSAWLFHYYENELFSFFIYFYSFNILKLGKQTSINNIYFWKNLTIVQCRTHTFLLSKGSCHRWMIFFLPKELLNPLTCNYNLFIKFVFLTECIFLHSIMWVCLCSLHSNIYKKYWSCFYYGLSVHFPYNYGNWIYTHRSWDMTYKNHSAENTYNGWSQVAGT